MIPTLFYRENNLNLIHNVLSAPTEELLISEWDFMASNWLVWLNPATLWRAITARAILEGFMETLDCYGMRHGFQLAGINFLRLVVLLLG